MGLTVDDGAGRGYSASVSDVLRLNVSAKTAERPFYISRDDQLAFTATSHVASAVAGDYVCYLQNTSSTRNMYIWEIHMGAVNNSLFKLWQVSGTGAGTTVTPSNLNLGSGLTAEATCLGNAAVTGLTAVKELHPVRVQANGNGGTEFFGALIIPPQEAVALEYDTGTTGIVDVNIEFHYEGIDRSK